MPLSLARQDKNKNMLNFKLSNKQIKILIIIFLIILLIIALVFILKKKGPEKINQPKPSESMEEIQREVPTIENKFTPQAKTEESIVSSVARNFAERLGSYSTDNREENFKSILPLMTDDLIANFKNTKALEKLNTKEYYGISSKALKIDTTISDTGDKAVSIVSLQQVENINNKQSIIYNKLDLDLIKNANTWLVDGAKWE